MRSPLTITSIDLNPIVPTPLWLAGLGPAPEPVKLDAVFRSSDPAFRSPEEVRARGLLNAGIIIAVSFGLIYWAAQK